MIGPLHVSHNLLKFTYISGTIHFEGIEVVRVHQSGAERDR